MGALETFGWEWGSALFRWLHVTAAIAWIGGSFFFMHLDASLRKRAGDDPALAGVSWQVHGGGFYEMSKYTLAPAVAAQASHLAQVAVLLDLDERLCAALLGLLRPVVAFPDRSGGDGARALAGGGDRDRGAGARLDRLRPPVPFAARLNEPLLAVVGFGYVVATSWVFTLFFSGRGALIHTGALMATIMTANVFFVIMPNQRKSVAALMAGAKARPEMGQDLQDPLDPQQLHHPAGAVPDAVEPLSVDLLQSAGHSGDRHLHHRRRRAGALFLQCLASRSRPRAVVGMGGRRRSPSFAPSASPRPLRRACARSWGWPTLPAETASLDQPKAPQEVVDIVQTALHDVPRGSSRWTGSAKRRRASCSIRPSTSRASPRRSGSRRF